MRTILTLVALAFGGTAMAAPPQAPAVPQTTLTPCPCGVDCKCKPGTCPAECPAESEVVTSEDLARRRLRGGSGCSAGCSGVNQTAGAAAPVQVSKPAPVSSPAPTGCQIVPLQGGVNQTFSVQGGCSTGNCQTSFSTGKVGLFGRRR